MKLKRTFAGCMALAMVPTLALVTAVTSQPQSTTVLQAFADDTETAKAQQLIALVNAYREQNGLEPFKTCDLMNTMAHVRATEITQGEYLNRADGSYYSSIFTEYGITTTIFNQNSYWGGVGNDSPEEAFNNFRDSSRNNMLNTAYEYIGIGVYVSDGKTYYYQLFCTSSDLYQYPDTTTTTTEESTTESTTTEESTTEPTTTEESTTEPTTTEESTTEPTTTEESTTEPTTTTTTEEPTTEPTTTTVSLSDSELMAKYNLDVNADGNVNAVDLLTIKKYLLGMLYA